MPAQLPSGWRTSPLVQGLPSSQAAPGLGTTSQVALPLQVRVAVSSLSQTIFLPTQAPSAVQVSSKVQGMSSLHALPVRGGFEHEPLAGSHIPAPRHWLAAGQVTGLPPLQVPPRQVSVRVQALP